MPRLPGPWDVVDVETGRVDLWMFHRDGRVHTPRGEGVWSAAGPRRYSVRGPRGQELELRMTGSDTFECLKYGVRQGLGQRARESISPRALLWAIPRGRGMTVPTP